MDDHVFRAPDCLKRPADQVRARLDQNLDGYVVRNEFFLDQRAQNFIFGFRSGREPNFDFLKTDSDKRLKIQQLFFQIHRIYQRLVPVAQVYAAPHGRFPDDFVRPCAIRQGNWMKRDILFAALIHTKRSFSCAAQEGGR